MSAPPPTREHLGHAIRRKRLTLKLTIEDLAGISKMHHTYLSGIERGVRNPTWQKLQDLATGLGTPLSAIVWEAENEAKLAQTGAASESAPSDR